MGIIYSEHLRLSVDKPSYRVPSYKSVFKEAVTIEASMSSSINVFFLMSNNRFKNTSISGTNFDETSDIKT